MPYPDLSQYQEAIRHPNIALRNTNLASYHPQTNQFGLPVAWSGNFAIVFCLYNNTNNTKYAIRCFSRQIADRQARYKAIGDTLKSLNLPYMVAFEYIENGILVNKKQYPIVSMEWIQGLTLDKFIEKNITHKAILEKLLHNFKAIVDSLHKHKIAHGDLQHGNMFVLEDGNATIKLIDYDGMYVPAFENLGIKHSTEIGHQNYQHPQRNSTHFNQYIDSFSSTVIELALTALIADSSYWQKRADPDTILFTKADFEKNLQTPLGRWLLSNSATKELAQKLQDLLTQAPDAAATATYITIPDWIKEAQMQARIEEETKRIKQEIQQRKQEIELKTKEIEQRKQEIELITQEINRLNQLAKTVHQKKTPNKNELDWWDSLDDEWKAIFSKQIKIDVIDITTPEQIQQIWQLKVLNCNNTKISSLAPVQQLNKLQILVCSNTSVSSLVPLHELRHLQELFCNNTKISSLAPLHELKHLQILVCSNTAVSHLVPLHELANLQILFCDNTPISSLQPLRKLTNLEKLFCNNTKINSLAPLNNMTKLQELDCSNTRVPDSEIQSLKEALPKLKINDF